MEEALIEMYLAGYRCADGQSVLNLAAARLRHIAGTACGRQSVRPRRSCMARRHHRTGFNRPRHFLTLGTPIDEQQRRAETELRGLEIGATSHPWRLALFKLSVFFNLKIRVIDEV